MWDEYAIKRDEIGHVVFILQLAKRQEDSSRLISVESEQILNCIVYAKIHRIHKENGWAYTAYKECDKKVNVVESKAMSSAGKSKITFYYEDHGAVQVASRGFGIARIIGQTKDIYLDMGDDVDISALTIEQYLAFIQDNNRPGIVLMMKMPTNNAVMLRVFPITHNGRALRLDISTYKLLDSRGFITLMTPTQALKLIQVMADHSHNWYDETTTKEKINDIPDYIDNIQESFKEAHPTKECPLKKEDEAVTH
ncbi:hypothetical protein Tco_1279998, partial [Tanacetum coccineum]